MNRTSQALKRLGVPVLAATMLFSVGQVALGTSAFAAANGTLTVAPDPAFGSATPTAGNGQSNDQTITYTTGTGSGANGDIAQVLNLSVSGSAQFVQPAAPTGTLNIAAGGKTATCTTTVPAPGGAGSTATCSYAVIDTVSEAAVVTIHDTTDVTTPDATATANFNGLHFTNCPSDAPNTAANCTTQTQVGGQTTYTVKYLEAGQPKANASVTFTVAGGAQVAASQPAGTAFFSPTQANCTTDAQGQCSVTIIENTVGQATITATTSNESAGYPHAKAVLVTNIITSTTAGRLVQGTQTLIKPSTQASNANQPGDAVQTQYTLYPCTAGSSTGNNACAADTAHPLSGVQVSLSVDHGFFTPNCTSADPSHTTNYANCTFDPTPAATKPVGNLKSLGTTITVTTDTNGQFIVTTGMGRDSAFDQAGSLTATITGTSGGATLTESQGTGNSPTGTACPAAGCAKGTAWTTDVAPLNGGAVKIVSVPASSSEQALSDTQNNNIPTNNNNVRVVVVHLTDQFGNLTSGGPANTAGVTLASTGVGDLERCTSYTASNTCSAVTNTQNVAGSATTTTDSSGTPTKTFANVRGSYLAAFTGAGAPTQDRYLVSNPADVAGTQTLKATWTAPVTTFNTFAAATAASPAVATYNATTATLTDTVVINWYDQNAQPVVTFSTTPSNSVKHGTVVTVSATVKDQFGNPIQGDNVQFVRSGPNGNNGTDCSATNGFSNTNAAGQAGFSFTCNNVSTQIVTIVVSDNSGNELARGTQTIKFTGTTSSKRHITAVINCFSPTKHHVVCKVHVTPKFKGLSVKFRNAGGKVVGVDDTNRHGNAYFRKAHMKSGKHHRYHAHVHSSSRTFGEDTGSDGVTVK